MNRKILAIIITFVLILSTISINAFAKADEIKFRNFEWGMTKNEVLQFIKENKADIGLPSEDTIESDSYQIDLLPLMINVQDKEEYNIEKEYNRYRVNYNKLTWWLFNTVDVAGYDADLQMRFANPVINGEIEENSDNGIFFEAEYSIRCKDKWESNKTYNELLEKLLAVYDSDSVVGNGLYDFNYTISYEDEVLDAKLLKAEDNSRILICRVHSSWGIGSDTVYIVYFAPNILELTKDSVEYYIARDKEFEAKRQAENDEKMNNVNGL